VTALPLALFNGSGAPGFLTARAARERTACTQKGELVQLFRHNRRASNKKMHKMSTPDIVLRNYLQSSRTKSLIITIM
jgi:hypothetical protein